MQYTQNDFKVEVNKNGALIKVRHFNKKGNGKLIIPEKWGVSTINQNAFSAETSSLKSLKLPPSITHIAEQTFHGQTALKEVFLPGVTSVGACAFQGCSKLKTVDAPYLENMQDDSFKDCPGNLRISTEAPAPGKARQWRHLFPLATADKIEDDTDAATS